MDTDFEIFKGKKFSDLLKNIYENSKKKERRIEQMITDLRPLIKTISDATIISPVIKDYLDVSVKNDDQLVKLASIIQRLVSATSKSETGDFDFGMSPEERANLIAEATKELKSIEESGDKIEVPKSDS